MSYFSDHYDDLRLPIATPDGKGFRSAQLGALHAIAAHFSQYRSPGIVTMPTGSGKTAVLVACAFLLRARRVLVLTPSRLIREQIAEQFEFLDDLHVLGALNQELAGAQVYRAATRISSPGEWAELGEYDVVVGIPQSISPEVAHIGDPPSGLFDLILVDEAHHSAARSWRGLLGRLQDSRQVLFTATPFRRDDREITGKFIYTYQLKDAYRDGVFGQIEYQAVVPGDGVDPDVAIARQAQRVLQADRAAGLAHSLLVRTGTRSRAKALAKLYARETTLRLQVVTGEHTLRHLRSALEKLRTNRLDGIISVDMLGEGVNLPTLKVAALHSPHKSLPVILQFIGRFARTNAPAVGRAVFLALASDMMVEQEALYQQGSVWHELIPTLAAARVEEEQRVREVLESFVPVPEPGPETVDLSLHALKPYHHVKILNAGEGIDIAREISFPRGFGIVHRHVSAEQKTVIYITRHRARPEWAMVEQFDNLSYDLFVIHYHQASGLLFICASRRDDRLYEHLAREYAVPGARTPRGLPLRKLNKVLLGITSPRFYNIGMRNAAAAVRAESYRTLAGSAVDHAIERSDGRLYRRGHWFGTGSENGTQVTIGLSSASKVWENAVGRIPLLVGWCARLADKITSNADPQTFSGLDHLGTGEEATNIPEGIAYVKWHHTTYQNPPLVSYPAADGTMKQGQLLDLEITIDRQRTNEHEIGLLIVGDDLAYRATFSLQTDQYIHADPENASEPVLGDMDEGTPLEAFLNDRPPVFYTSDFAELEGADFFPAPNNLPPYDPERIDTRDWAQIGVDIQLEVGDQHNGRSVHQWLEEELEHSDSTIIFYDHGSGEMADFLTIEERDDQNQVTFYHCKASGGPAAGQRVNDAYEVCSQAVKSTAWMRRDLVLRALDHRTQTRGPRSRFIRGDLGAAQTLLGTPGGTPFTWRVVIVQPGLSRAQLNAQMASILAATDDFVQRSRCERLVVIASE